jgi:simple sugar transport system ATP-binding protein
MLEMRGISKRFGGVQALDDVSLRVGPGAVHALLGENGAGKSTLMHIAAGLMTADGGEVSVHGHLLGGAAQLHAGIGMVHQHLSLVPTMTAAENFALGATGRLDLPGARRRLQGLSAESGLLVEPDARVDGMSLVQQQRLEILKALGRGAQLIIMDEPTAVLAPAEATDLLAWVRAFAAKGGSVILVTHKLREALAVADEITVLRRGRVAWSGGRTGATEESLAEAIFPERPTAEAFAAPPRGENCVVASAITLGGARAARAVDGASFTIARGEIVAVAAVEGNGQRELLASLAGLLAPAAGTLELPDRIAFIPADRRLDAIVPEFTLTENVALRGLGRRRGRMPWHQLRARSAELIREFAIAAPAPETRAVALSGGNQQRLVVARELSEPVDLVVAEHPTRGLDLNATAFVHRQLRNAAASGAAVVVHSSDLDELLALATRVLVVFRGRVTEVAPDRELVGRAMLGAS